MKILSVNINDECADALRAYARAHDVMLTEAIRRAISVLCLIDAQELRGNLLAVLEPTRRTRRGQRYRVLEILVVTDDE